MFRVPTTYLLLIGRYSYLVKNDTTLPTHVLHYSQVATKLFDNVGGFLSFVYTTYINIDTFVFMKFEKLKENSIAYRYRAPFTYTFEILDFTDKCECVVERNAASHE